MYDNIAIVKQQPAGIYGAFMVVRYDAIPLKVLFYLIIDGAELPLIITGTYNEIVGKAAYFTGIKQHDIGCLFFAGGVHGGAGYFNCFQ